MTDSVRPAKSLVVLAADILTARAKDLLHCYAHGSSCDFTTARHVLEEAVRMYTEARIDSTMRESMDILLRPVDEALKICDEQSLEFERVMEKIEAKFKETKS